MLKAINEVYFCKDPDDFYSDYSDDLEPLNNGLSPELILKVIKWLFIEQDIRYWNWSGRKKFMDYIKRV